ncbi:hypothetical protein SUGI_0429320, partial [Cryptomeria japonica]
MLWDATILQLLFFCVVLSVVRGFLPCLSTALLSGFGGLWSLSLGDSFSIWLLLPPFLSPTGRCFCSGDWFYLIVAALVEMLVAEEGGVVKGFVLGYSRDIWDLGGFSLDSNGFVLLVVHVWGALPPSWFWVVGLHGALCPIFVSSMSACLLLFLSLFSQPYGLFSIFLFDMVPSHIEVEMMSIGNMQFPNEVEIVVVILVGRSWREALELLALVWLGFECGLIVLFTPLLLIEVVMLAVIIFSDLGASSSILQDLSLDAGDFLIVGSLLSSSFLSSSIEMESAVVLV